MYFVYIECENWIFVNIECKTPLESEINYFCMVFAYFCNRQDSLANMHSLSWACVHCHERTCVHGRKLRSMPEHAFTVVNIVHCLLRICVSTLLILRCRLMPTERQASPVSTRAPQAAPLPDHAGFIADARSLQQRLQYLWSNIAIWWIFT